MGGGKAPGDETSGRFGEKIRRGFLPLAGAFVIIEE